MIPLNTNRGRSFTIYGAVSDCLRTKFYSELHDSTCKVDFITFIENLAAQVIPGQKPVLVLDNHAAHTSQATRQVMERFFTVEFIPPYSCELN